MPSYTGTYSTMTSTSGYSDKYTKDWYEDLKSKVYKKKEKITGLPKGFKELWRTG